MKDPMESLLLLLGYDRRRYWLGNGWSLRFRVWDTGVTEHRPHGIRHAMTLHDQDGTRLLGVDNAHGVSRSVVRWDHRHLFKRTVEVLPYEYRGAERLLVDFFDAVERACEDENLTFDFVGEDLIEDEEPSDETGDRSA